MINDKQSYLIKTWIEGLMDMPDDVVFRIHYNGVFKYDPLRYKQFRVVEMHACTIDWVMFSHLLDMLVGKVKDNIWALFFCIPGLDIDSGGLKLMENDVVKKHAGNMSVEELVAWVEEKAKYPYLRSPPLKSRPFRNDMKGRVLFTDMYCAKDERFEMYPPLNEDEVGKEDLLVWCSDLENDCINDAAKILEGMSESKNDSSKSVEINKGVQVLVDEMSKGVNDAANIDIYELVLARQKQLNKGKCLMTDDDIVTTKKRKTFTKGNGVSIRENDGVNYVSTDNESDSDDHGDQQSEIDSDESNKSFDYLSNGEDEVLNLRKEEFSLNVMVLKLLMKIIMKLVMQKELLNAKNYVITKGDVTIQDHYGYLRSYAKALAESNVGSTVKVGVTVNPKNFFGQLQKLLTQNYLIR
ncbi:hypothetical protein Tco_0547713 [Tanacetum coccineum]